MKVDKQTEQELFQWFERTQDLWMHSPKYSDDVIRGLIQWSFKLGYAKAKGDTEPMELMEKMTIRQQRSKRV